MVRLHLALALLVLALAAPAEALNKQGERSEGAEEESLVNLSGYLFAGGFAWNPTYAARPNNTGLALGRFGLHLDLDLFERHLTLSYDENTFTDGAQASTRGWYKPSEADHIVGLLSTFQVAPTLTLTGALHYELDLPLSEASVAYRQSHPDCYGSAPAPGCYPAGYSQSYVDAYGRLTFEPEGRVHAFAALGAFLWNPTYAARPDNSGLALFRYVGHVEVELAPWLSAALDLNSFTDRDVHWVVPSELDTVVGLIGRYQSLQASLVGEWDAPLTAYPAEGPHPAAPRPGLSQYYVALLLQWSFDLHLKVNAGAPGTSTETLPQGHLPSVH